MLLPADYVSFIDNARDFDRLESYAQSHIIL